MGHHYRKHVQSVMLTNCLLLSQKDPNVVPVASSGPITTGANGSVKIAIAAKPGAKENTVTGTYGFRNSSASHAIW